MRRALLLVVLLSGCSVDEATFVGDGAVDSSIDTLFSGDTSTDAPLGDTTSEDAEDAADSVVSEVASDAADSAEAEADADAAPVDSGDPCDKDGDGFKARGGSCGGNDCDDDDRNANPGVMALQTFNATGKSHGGDWNCDSTVDRQYGINVSCAALLAGTACNALRGFTGNPTCGTSATWVQCGTSAAFCVEASSKMELQACK